MLIKIAPELQKYTSFISEFNSSGSFLGDCLQNLFNEFPQLLVFFVADDAKEAKRTTLKLNGRYVFEVSENYTTVTPECVLELAQDIPEGEDGAGKILIGAALIGASFMLPGVGAAGVSAFWAAHGAMITSAVFSMGVGLAIGGVAELVMGKPQLPLMESGGDSPTYGPFDGIKNTTVSGTPIPIVYGKHRVGGQLVSTYLDVRGGASYLRAQIGLSEGTLPEGFLDIDTIKVNNISFSDMPISDKQVNLRRGNKNQTPPPKAAFVPTDDVVLSNLLDIPVAGSLVEYLVDTVCDSVELSLVDNTTDTNFTYYAQMTVWAQTYKIEIEEKIGNDWLPLKTIYAVPIWILKERRDTIKVLLNNLGNTTHLFRLKAGTFSWENEGYFGTVQGSLLIKYVMTTISGDYNNDTKPEMEFFSDQKTTVSYNNQLIPRDTDADYITNLVTPEDLLGNTYTTTSEVDAVDVILFAPAFYSESGSKTAYVDVNVYWVEDGGTFQETQFVSFPTLVTKDGKGSKIEHEWVLKIPFPSQAVYRLKVVRATSKHTTLEYQDDVYVKALNETVVQGQIHPQLGLLGIHLKANDIVSGGMPTITSEMLGVQVPVPLCINSVAGHRQYYTSTPSGSSVQRYMKNADAVSASSIWSGKLTDDSTLTVAVSATCTNGSDVVVVASTTGLYLGQFVELDVNELRYKITAISGLNVTLEPVDPTVSTVQFIGTSPTTTTLRNATKFWTNNPVWCLYDLLTNERYGLSKYYPIAPSKKGLVLANFYTMATYCDQYITDAGLTDGITYATEGARPRFSLDLVMDSSKKAAEWVNIICASMRASWYYSEGIIWIDIDRPKSITQLFNMSNIKDYVQSGSSYKGIPNVLDVQFLNKNKDYEQDTFLIESEDYASDLTKEERRKSVQLYGVTDERQARSLGYYVLQAARLALTTVSFKTGTHGLLSSVGDVVGIQHDVPQWGYGGQVFSYVTNTKVMKLSDTITFVAGHNYSISLSQAGLPPQSYGIVEQAAGTVTDTITLTSNAGTYPELTFTPAKGDIYVIGDASNIVKPFRITSLKRDKDDFVSVTAINYDADIYPASDQVTNLGYTGNNYSLLPKGSRSVKNVLAEINLYTDTTGNLKTGVNVYYSPIYNNVQWQGVIVYYGVNGNYTQMPIDRTGTVFIPEINIEGDYQFVCVSVFTDGSRQTINEALYDFANVPFYNLHITPFVENTEFLKGVSGLQLVGQGNNLEFVGKSAKFTWRKPAALDYKLNDYASDKPLGTDTSNSWLKEYRITIRNVDGSLRHATKVYDEYYEYKYEQNYEDGTTIPVRSFIFEVEPIDRLGRVGKKASITVANPAPAMLT